MSKPKDVVLASGRLRMFLLDFRGNQKGRYYAAQVVNRRHTSKPLAGEVECQGTVGKLIWRPDPPKKERKRG